jgi:hypothetical protein
MRHQTRGTDMTSRQASLLVVSSSIGSILYLTYSAHIILVDLPVGAHVLTHYAACVHVYAQRGASSGVSTVVRRVRYGWERYHRDI